MTKEIHMTRVGSNAEPHQTSTGHAFSSADWLDVHFMAMRPEYEAMLRWVGLQPGWHVLDAACGSGSYLPLMTELVGSDGKVSAIDLAPESIRTVQERAEQSGWPAPVSARVGSILDLPYDDDSFDAVWNANTTMYLTDDELCTMLAEYRRVTRPGGLIAIKAYDGTTEQVQPSTPTLFIHLIETRCRNGSQLDCGLLRVIELPKWLREAGLVDLQQKPTLVVRFQPLDSAVKQFVADLLQGLEQQAQQVELPEEEARLWKKLADTNSPDHILCHPDFQYRVIETVFVARVPR
jgi:arsenite methyltransferase